MPQRALVPDAAARPHRDRDLAQGIQRGATKEDPGWPDPGRLRRTTGDPTEKRVFGILCAAGMFARAALYERYYRKATRSRDGGRGGNNLSATEPSAKRRTLGA